MKESKVVTFIGGFYIFGGIIVLLSFIFNGSPLNVVFDLPNVPEYIVKLAIALIYIPLGYLYVKRVKYSNWVVVIFAIIFMCISAELVTEFEEQPFIGNLIYSIFVIVVTIVRRKEFTNKFCKLFKLTK